MASVANTVNVDVPEAVGVPETFPFEFRLNPLGSVPLNCYTPSTVTRIQASRVVATLTFTCAAAGTTGVTWALVVVVRAGVEVTGVGFAAPLP